MIEKDIEVPKDDHLDGEQPLGNGPGRDHTVRVVGIVVTIGIVLVIIVLTVLSFR